jgi:hypothetical protein
MVEIRVAVAGAACAHGLLRRLTGLFDRSSVSFDGTSNESAFTRNGSHARSSRSSPRSSRGSPQTASIRPSCRSAIAPTRCSGRRASDHRADEPRDHSRGMALQLSATARSVQTQPPTTRALSRLRRRTPQRPDRAREHEARTASINLPECRQNLALKMIRDRQADKDTSIRVGTSMAGTSMT